MKYEPPFAWRSTRSLVSRAASGKQGKKEMSIQVRWGEVRWGMASLLPRSAFLFSRFYLPSIKGTSASYRADTPQLHASAFSFKSWSLFLEDQRMKSVHPKNAAIVRFLLMLVPMKSFRKGGRGEHIDQQVAITSTHLCLLHIFLSASSTLPVSLNRLNCWHYSFIQSFTPISSILTRWFADLWFFSPFTDFKLHMFTNWLFSMLHKRAVGKKSLHS